MKVLIPGGEVFDLGATETNPTVGITDYSRRVTDDYGVTTVVKRDFSRTLSVRVGVPIALVDAVQRKLAALRATVAQWVANDVFACLSVNGFFKDFDLDISMPPLGYCTLTVEGLSESEPFTDPGGDPAPFGQLSTLRLLQPAEIDDTSLVASNLVENDYPQWATGTTYALGARVLRGSSHRIYESTAAGNVGNDPTAPTGKWSDIGPTNRFAMFDQALGSTSDNAGSIAVTLDAPSITAVALLDVTGTSVRVQATGYDRTQPVGAGAITFLDLPAGLTRATVTIAGSGTVSVGTLLVSKLVALGVTEASPTAGITDFSRKDTDDFGAVTIVERAWAKRMTANALVSTSAIDSVFSRIAAVRATPALWIAQTGYDSLTVYGFFKEFSIEAGDTVSKLSLSIEGLSTAGKITPFAPGGSVDWPNVGDPDGTKPADNATNGRDPTSPLGTTTVGDFESKLAAARAQLAYIDGTTIPTINQAVSSGQQAAADALAQAVKVLNASDAQINTRIDSVSAEGGYNDTAVYAEVRRVDQTAISRDGTIGQRIDSVITNYQTADTNTNARVDQVATSASNASQAVADLSTSVNTRFSGVNTTLSSYDGRITTLSNNVLGYANRTDTLEAQLNGDSSSRLLSRAVDQATATVDAKIGAVAQSVQTLSASIGTAGGNVLKNSNFITTDGWSFATYSPNGPMTATPLINAAGDDYHPTGENVLSVIQEAATGGGAFCDWVSDKFPASSAQPMQFYAFANSHRSDVDIFVIWQDANGQVTGSTSSQRVAGPGGLGKTPENFTRIGIRAVRPPAGTSTGYLVLRKYDTNAGQSSSFAWFWRPYAGEARDGQTSWNPYAAGTGAASEAKVSATLVQQAGVLAGLDGRSSVYWSVTGTTGDGSTRIQLSKASGQTGLFYVEANMLLAGNLVVDGTITARKFDRTSMAREGSASWQGLITPDLGQTVTVPWGLTLSQVPALGRFVYELQVGLTSNAGQQQQSTVNGKPGTLTFVEAGGGLTIVAVDNQGNQYRPVANSWTTVLATTDFVPSWTARITRGSYDTGWVNNGDTYERQIAAVYSVSFISLKAMWVAI